MSRNFSSSGLVRLLGDLEQVDHPVQTGRAGRAPAEPADAPGQDFAEKLSQWVGVFEAGKLHAVHQAASEPVRALPGRMRAPAVPLKEQLHQVRAILARAIVVREPAPAGAGRGRQAFSQPVPPQAEADFAPYRQHYQDQQRNMELMIGPLRDSVRQTLSATSPELRQLAALDAVWEQMLAVREQKLLSAVPLRLKRRFESLRKSQQQASQDEPRDQQESLDFRQESLAHAPLKTGDWLDVFGRELQQVLQAELDARLEPVTGLIEAFEQEG